MTGYFFDYKSFSNSSFLELYSSCDINPLSNNVRNFFNFSVSTSGLASTGAAGAGGGVAATGSGSGAGATTGWKATFCGRSKVTEPDSARFSSSSRRRRASAIPARPTAR